VLWPLMTYGLYAAAGSDWSLWDVYADEPTLANGPLWFVEVLLIYSLIYAAWVGWRSRRGREPNAVTTGPLRARHLVALGAGIAIATFVVRRWFPRSIRSSSRTHTCGSGPNASRSLARGSSARGAGGSAGPRTDPPRMRLGGAGRDRHPDPGLRVDPRTQRARLKRSEAAGAGRRSCSQRSGVRCRSPRRSGSSRSPRGIGIAPARSLERWAAPPTRPCVQGRLSHVVTDSVSRSRRRTASRFGRWRGRATRGGACPPREPCAARAGHRAVDDRPARRPRARLPSRMTATPFGSKSQARRSGP
jgi:hypothetical protein